jgi:tRNA threonylcarbamoyladenosine biosynthesis protein TsaE
MGLPQTKIILSSAEEMLAFGEKIAKSLRPDSVVALTGDLGTGKTTFVQGLARGLKIADPVQSPTFVTLNLYEGTLPLFHFELYRFKEGADFFKLGFEEYFQKGGVCAIEWPQKIADFLPDDTLHIDLQHYEGNKRMALIREEKNYAVR